MFLTAAVSGVPDDAERLRVITADSGKRRPDQGVAGIVALPASLARLGVAWAGRFAASRINLYVTNIPGPPSALYLAGARLLPAVPLAPLVAGCAAERRSLSYDGQLALSLLVDDNLPDLPILTQRRAGRIRGLCHGSPQDGLLGMPPPFAWPPRM